MTTIIGRPRYRVRAWRNTIGPTYEREERDRAKAIRLADRAGKRGWFAWVQMISYTSTSQIEQIIHEVLPHETALPWPNAR